MDETKPKVNGKQVYIRAAMDVEAREILEARVTLSRSCLERCLFLSTDKGPWYNARTCRMFKKEKLHRPTVWAAEEENQGVFQ